MGVERIKKLEYKRDDRLLTFGLYEDGDLFIEDDVNRPYGAICLYRNEVEALKRFLNEEV